MKSIRFIIIVFFFLLVVSMTTSLFSQWYNEQLGTGSNGSVAVDPQGEIHLCYLSKSFGGDLIYAGKSGGNWVNQTLTHSGSVIQCAMVADHLSIIHIVYIELVTDGPRLLKYIKKEGNNFSSPQIITFSDDGRLWSVSLDVDNDGYLHVGYIQAYGMASLGPLVYMNNREGQWKVKFQSSSYEDYAYGCASLAVDQNDHVHFAFYNLSGGGPGYRTNAPNGNWSDAVFFDENWIGGQMESMQIDIAVDMNNTPHISYVGSNVGEEALENHLYATKKSGNWITQKVDNGSNLSCGHAIACDPEGVIHIVYYHYATGELRYAMNSSGSWPHETIDKPGASYDRRVNMVSDKYGAMHIVYHNNQYVFYATKRIEIPAPNIVLSPPALAFGTVDTGAVSTLPLNIKNEGVLDLHITDIKLTGKDSSEFSLEHFCNTIVPGDSCTVNISFVPGIIGRKQSTLRITSDDPDTPVKLAAITGRTPFPVIETEPALIEFPVVEVGKSDTMLLMIKNSGDMNLKIDTFKITGEGADAYSCGSTCWNIIPSTSCNLEVYFTPSSTGTHYADLSLYSNDPERPVVRVSLKGRPPSGRLEVSQSDQDSINNILDFGTVPIGKIITKELILKNTGERNLMITSRNISGADSSLFNASNPCALVLPGDSCSMDIQFHSLSIGLKTAMLRITTNDPDLPEYTLTLKGTCGAAESWSFTYGTDENERFYCMDTLSSGDLIIGGTSGLSAYLAVMSANGHITWQKKLSGGSGPNFIHAVRETWDNGFVAAGQSGNNYRWIARLDKDGKIIWQKQTENDYWGKIRDVQVTSDSGFIAVGETWPRGSGEPDLWIGKFDSTGTVLWQKNIGTYGGSGDEYWQRGFDVLETYEGNFIVAGSATTDNIPYHALRKHPDGGYLYGGETLMMLKFSPDGTLLWQRRFSGSVNKAFWLAHISATDEILWQYSYPQSQNLEWIFDLTLTKSGDIIALGTENKSNNNDMRVMRLTKTGNIVWQKIYTAPGNQEGNKVQVHSSGSVAIAGYYETKPGDTDGWLLFMSQEGLLQGCTSDYLKNSIANAISTSYVFQDMNLLVGASSSVFINGTMVASTGNLESENSCTGIPTDIDSDGIANDEEYGPSGQDTSYDGNKDGLPDALQNNVTSFHTFTGSEYVTLETPSGTQLREVSAADNPSPNNQPAEFEFPVGFFDFKVTGIENGGSVAVNLIIPQELTPNTYYKYGKTAGNTEPHWYEFLYNNQTGAEIKPGIIILHFKDGGRGDEDLAENGVIVDIGGPGKRKSSTDVQEQPDYSTVNNSVTIYPNPFSTFTNIGFSLYQPEDIKIEIYNFTGQKIRTLINEKMVPGYHEVKFHAESLQVGIYFLRIQAGLFNDTKKMIILK